MRLPGASSFRTAPPGDMPGTGSLETVRPASEPDLSPEEAPKACSSCQRPLTVGERMFYFLEGGGSVPVCRSCLARQPATCEEDGMESPALGPSSEPSPDDSGGQDGAPPLAHTVRRFLEDELNRIDLVVDRFPATQPDLPLVRSVQQEAQDHLSHDRLADAIVSMSDLRRILTEIDRGRQRAPLSAAWEESIEELFDRVITRARAMSRRLPPLPEWDEELIEPGVHGTLRDSRAPS